MLKTKSLCSTLLTAVASLALLTGCSGEASAPAAKGQDTVAAETGTETNTDIIEVASSPAPGSAFDLSKWSLTVPLDENEDDRADIIKLPALETYQHPNFFYLNEEGQLVFTSPNKATTTPNSTNTRSELRHVSAGADTSVNDSDPANNWAVKSNPDSDAFAAIGGKMRTTLHVDHVSRRAGLPDKPPAYSAVIGQIHAVKIKPPSETAGWGNEPLKIFYKKWPDHENGSVFWTYERNLAKEDPKRTDIVYGVWGNTWENPADPGADGISLGETISYEVNVVDDVMHLTFEADGRETVTYDINLADNVDANGVVDPDDNPHGYTGDMLYFKAGVYNQCSTRSDPGLWYAGCPGTGEWATDKANGDYAQVTFHSLELSPATPR